MSSSYNSENEDKNEDENEDDSCIDWSQKIFNDRYIAIIKLGKGSYCAVWLSYDQKLNKMIALKIYNREDYKRAKREIKIFDEIKSKNISNVITYIDKFIYIDDELNSYDEDSDSDLSEYSTNKFFCVTMELCGYSLNDIINIFKENNMNIPSLLILDLHDKIRVILDELHRKGLAHTDIKPENILIDKPKYNILKFIQLEKELKNKKRKDIMNRLNKVINELKNVYYDISDIYNYIVSSPSNIYLCDMGTTMKPGDNILYKKYTLYYRSPEAILEIGWDFSYDLWSLGCVLYELLTNEILFNVDSNIELLYDIQTKLGLYPKNLIEQSPIKYKYYNQSLTRIRGYKKIIYKTIFNLSSDSDNEIKIINLIAKYVSYDIINRNT